MFTFAFTSVLQIHIIGMQSKEVKNSSNNCEKVYICLLTFNNCFCIYLNSMGIEHVISVA